ncbi:hypothetical protein ES703_90501 [subsurface metagenome]
MAAFDKATKASTHYGQLGSESEEIVRELLNEHLPLKYYADTGFVRTLEKPGWESKQIDILLVRRDICFPLAILKRFKVYPIESVIGFMEVTSKVNKGKLTEDFEKVVDLKRLYKRHCHIPKPPIGTQFCQVDAPHPRFYYFAFSTDWAKPQTVNRVIKEMSREYGIQLHAMFVLGQGCYVSPTPTKDNPSPDVIFTPNMPDSFIGFLYHILMNLQTADFLPPNASIPFQEYFDQDFSLPVLRHSTKQNHHLDQESET